MELILKLIERLIPYKRIRKESIFNVLVVDLNYSGDMLMSSPVYRELKKRLAPVTLDCLVYDFCKPVMEHNPYVDYIRTLKDKKFLTAFFTCLFLRRKYDLVLQLNTSLRTNFLMWFIAPLRLGYNYKHRGCFNNVRVPISQRTAHKGYRVDECVDLIEKGFGWKIKDRSMVFDIQPIKIDLPKRKIGNFGSAIIGIHTCTREMEVVFHVTPNSTGDKRKWDKWHLLADYLIWEKGARIIFVGIDKDKEYVNSIIEKIINKDKVHNLVGVTTLDGLVCILKYCELLVCVNSFVMHLGVCLGTKMFAIVGATPPKITLPPHIPHLYSKYAKDIELEDVINAIKEILK